MTESTLAEFLLARLDERERVADWMEQGPLRGVVYVGTADGTPMEVTSPAHVRANARASRAIVKAAKAAFTDDGLQYALRHLAAVYADHPDYRQEWRA